MDRATEIHATVATDAIFCNGLMIQLTDDSELQQQPFASMSNTAVEADLAKAMEHFQAYYDASSGTRTGSR